MFNVSLLSRDMGANDQIKVDLCAQWLLFQEEAEGTGSRIHARNRGAVSQPGRWSACSLVPAHTRSLKVRSDPHPIFSLTNNPKEMFFMDTEVLWW